MAYIKDYAALQQALADAGFYHRQIDGRFLYLSGQARNEALAAGGLDLSKASAGWFSPPSEDPPDGWADQVIDRQWPDANAQVALEQWFMARAGISITVTGEYDDAHFAALTAYEDAHPGSVEGL